MTITNKFDTHAAETIVMRGNAAAPGILEWVQDLNWPVAQVLMPFLANAGSAVIPGIRQVLTSNDDTWKWSILCGVVAKSPELTTLLQQELGKILSTPTTGEHLEGLDQIATELLKSIGVKN